MLNKDVALDVLQDGFDDTTREAIETSIRITTGRAERSDYIVVTKLADVYRKKAEEYGVELEDRTEALMQNIYRQIATAYWTSKAIFDCADDPDVIDVVASNPLLDPDHTFGFFKAVGDLMADHSIEPAYTYDDFLDEAVAGLAADILLGEVLIEAEMISTDDRDYKITKKLHEHFQAEKQEAEL